MATRKCSSCAAGWDGLDLHYADPDYASNAIAAMSSGQLRGMFLSSRLVLPHGGPVSP